jgi:chloride channel protein, CIC family
MTGRHERWGRSVRLAADVVLTVALAFVVALSVGRMVAWVKWLVQWPGRDDLWFAAVPVAGAVVAIVVVAAGRATPSTADAYAQGVNDGHLSIEPAPIRFLGLASGVGAGVPLGYEGPMVYFGGAVGAFVARRWRGPERWLVLATATSAVAMVVGAPIAAALFASEVARRGLPRRADVAPLALGAGAAWFARRLTGEPGGILGVDLGLDVGRIAVGVVAIAGAAGLVARVFVAAIRRAKRVQAPLVARVVAVVLLLGVAGPVAWLATDAPVLVGSGERLREWAMQASQPELVAVWLLFGLVVVVLVACGVVGGLFLPLLSLGAVLGLLVGRAWLPDVPAVACIGIGACCMLAAGYGTPLTAVALAVSSFGATSAAWATAGGIVLASTIAGDRSVSMFQLSSRARRWRRRALHPQAVPEPVPVVVVAGE